MIKRYIKSQVKKLGVKGFIIKVLALQNHYTHFGELKEFVKDL